MIVRTVQTGVETAASGVGRGRRVDHGVGRTTAVAGVRGARQAAERAARERLAGTLIGAAGELEVAVAQHAAAAGVIAARERAAAHVRRLPGSEAERVVADAAAGGRGGGASTTAPGRPRRRAGWSPAALADLGYPPPVRKESRSQRQQPASPPAARRALAAEVGKGSSEQNFPRGGRAA